MEMRLVLPRAGGGSGDVAIELASKSDLFSRGSAQVVIESTWWCGDSLEDQILL